MLTATAYLLNLGMYLLPGTAAAYLSSRHRKLSTISLLIVLFGTAALLGYASFWIFLFNKATGRIFSYLVYLVSISLVIAASRQRDFWKTIWIAARDPLLFIALGGILYLSLLFLFGDAAGQGAALANARFFEEYRPGDNLIPLIFADKIYSDQPLRPFCCGDWLSSDRPPLQAGAVLLLWPLRIAGTRALNYQALSTLLQCLWMAGVWSLLSACRVSVARSRQVLVLLVLSGFFFYNSVFVWPKLLAAAFILFAIAIIVRTFRDRRPVGFADAGLGGLSLSLALLSHPGSIFSLPAFAAAALWKRNLFPWRALGTAAVAPLLLLSSWSAYQHWIDPPGNRLTKMHLAGVIPIDDRSVAQALADSYQRLSWQTIAAYKRANLRNLIGTDPLDSFDFFSLTDPGQTEHSRVVQREYIWNAVGVLNIGWFGLLFWWLRGRRTHLELLPFAWLLLAALFNLVVWSLTLFGPHATYTTHSSYADILLLTASLAIFLLLLLPRWVGGLVLALQIFNLIAVWTWSTPAKYFPHPNPLPEFLAIALASAAVLIWIFLKAWSLPQSQSPPS